MWSAYIFELHNVDSPFGSLHCMDVGTVRRESQYSYLGVYTSFVEQTQAWLYLGWVDGFTFHHWITPFSKFSFHFCCNIPFTSRDPSSIFHNPWSIAEEMNNWLLNIAVQEQARATPYSSIHFVTIWEHQLPMVFGSLHMTFITCFYNISCPLFPLAQTNHHCPHLLPWISSTKVCITLYTLYTLMRDGSAVGIVYIYTHTVWISA